MKNLYLIGFMGAGKSTIARALAKKCPSKRIEMDQLIEEQQGMAITDIFAAHGENYFRDLETELLRSFSESTGYVVSCGGGSVLRDENAALMKENGISASASDEGAKQVTGKIAKLFDAVVEGNSHCYVILEESDQIYDVSVADYIAIVRYEVGDTITLEYTEDGEAATVLGIQ